MNYRDALDILELDDTYTLKQLKQSYYKKCLMYHPDKNPNGENHFKKVKNAYDILIEYCETDCNTGTNQYDYVSLLQKYITIIAEKYSWDKDIIMDVFHIITNKKQEITIELFKRFKKETMIEIFELIHKYKNIFNITDDFIQKIKNEILEKNKKLIVYELNPSIQDLFENNVYIFEIEERKYYIPLWHSEVYFDKFIFIITPELPNNMTIDNENNIHVYIHLTRKEIFENKYLKVNLYREKNITFESDNLYCRRKQIYTLKRQGINKINEKDIFNSDRKSDIILHIDIE